MNGKRARWLRKAGQAGMIVLPYQQAKARWDAATAPQKRALSRIVNVRLGLRPRGKRGPYS